jgi:hypothetical protein
LYGQETIASFLKKNPGFGSSAEIPKPDKKVKKRYKLTAEAPISNLPICLV